MKVMAQMAMVMNLDKCIGCHTCSVTCKQAWTNRSGTEYVWFNNVETRPGVGYPRTYEDQERWRGGWVRDKKGRLRLRDGGRIHKLLRIFANPKLPTIGDYYEPWTYDYENLTSAPAGDTFPTAAPRSLISGNPMKVSWGSNWDDNLAGSPEIVPNDPVLKKVNQVNQEVKLKLEETFMFYLPRICEHCLNPSCVASCPSGAMYKRTEDGIVLVDQDRCRGWRMCVSGCPYKKVYFNHKTGKAEKCTLCYPRIEVGLPTVCSETCVGRLRYLGLVLYDVDQVLQAASVESDTDLYEAQRRILLDPHDPRVIAGARAEGIADEWIEAAQRSPVYALINTYRVALPLHPEYRTMPMVWYIPPLSPVVDAVSRDGDDYTGRPFSERRAALVDAVTGSGADADLSIHVTPATTDMATAQRWFSEFEGAGLDGVIAKPPHITYQPDKRVMFKIKHLRTADCVVAGYRVHKSGSDAIGSLLLGLYQEDGQLASVGVIGAFPMAERRRLLTELQPLVTSFDDHPWNWAAHVAGQRTPRKNEFSRWNVGKDLSFVPLRPERVVEVRYDHMEGARFRHTAQFNRWRPDRDPRSCSYAQLERPLTVSLSDIVPGLR